MWGLYSRLCSALPSRPHSQRHARDSRRELRRQWHSDLIDFGEVVCEPLLHAAVNALGYPLPLSVSPSSADEHAQVQPLTPQVQAVTGEHVEIAYVDQGYTGPDAATSAAQHGIALVLTKIPQPSAASSSCPDAGWWSSFAWMSRCRRPARDCERLPRVLTGLHCLAFCCLMPHQLIHLFSSS